MAGFTAAEWRKIYATLEADPNEFGLPKRRTDSVVFASFNIRKLGAVDSRTKQTWEFLAYVCKRFDLVAIQEVMNDVSGLQHLVKLMGKDYGLIASDATGAFRAGEGLQERLAFVFNWRRVARTEVASDVTYDRTKVLDTLSRNSPAFHNLLHPYGTAAISHEAALQAYRNKTGPKPGKKPTLGAPLPTFLTFIRTPFMTSFEVKARRGHEPYRIIAVNAHLNFGNFVDDRWQDFGGLMDWLDAHVHDKHTYYPDCILLGDLNLKFDKPERDRDRIDEKIKDYDREASRGVHVNFPFLTPHRVHGQIRSNARQDQTYDQIGLFFRDKRLPTYDQNAKMPVSRSGPDYGVFNFVDLFAQAVEGEPFNENWSKTRKNAFYKRFEHKVSDHMPIWVRLPKP